jgi:hypothetical protein
MRWLIAGLILALVASNAQAQLASPQSSMSAASHVGEHNTHADDKEQKPKANDKAYDAALHNLPDRQYDPWHGVR